MGDPPPPCGVGLHPFHLRRHDKKYHSSPQQQQQNRCTTSIKSYKEEDEEEEEEKEEGGGVSVGQRKLTVDSNEDVGFPPGDVFTGVLFCTGGEILHLTFQVNQVQND